MILYYNGRVAQNYNNNDYNITFDLLISPPPGNLDRCGCRGSVASAAGLYKRENLEGNPISADRSPGRYNRGERNSEWGWAK